MWLLFPSLAITVAPLIRGGDGRRPQWMPETVIEPNSHMLGFSLYVPTYDKVKLMN